MAREYVCAGMLLAAGILLGLLARRESIAEWAGLDLAEEEDRDIFLRLGLTVVLLSPILWGPGAVWLLYRIGYVITSSFARRYAKAIRAWAWE